MAYKKKQEMNGKALPETWFIQTSHGMFFFGVFQDGKFDFDEFWHLMQVVKDTKADFFGKDLEVWPNCRIFRV